MEKYYALNGVALNSLIPLNMKLRLDMIIVEGLVNGIQIE